MKEKQTKYFCYLDMQKTTEPSIDQQKKSVVELTKAITTGNEKIGNTILKVLKTYYEKTEDDFENSTKLRTIRIEKALVMLIFVLFLWVWDKKSILFNSYCW